MTIQEVVAPEQGSDGVGPTGFDKVVPNCLPGDVLVVSVGTTLGRPGQVMVISSDDGATWSNENFDIGRIGTVSWAEVVGTGNVTVTMTNATESNSCIWCLWHLRDDAGGIDLHSTSQNQRLSNGNPNQVAPAGTDYQDEGYVVLGANHSGNTNGITASDGLTVLFAVQQVGMYEKSTSTRTAYGEYTTATARHFGAVLHVFKPRSAGGPPPVHPLSGFGHPLGRPRTGQSQTFHPLSEG